MNTDHQAAKRSAALHTLRSMRLSVLCASEAIDLSQQPLESLTTPGVLSLNRGLADILRAPDAVRSKLPTCLNRFRATLMHLGSSKSNVAKTQAIEPDGESDSVSIPRNTPRKCSMEATLHAEQC